MHPSRYRLELFVENRLDAVEKDRVIAHLDECELCREYYEEYRGLSKSLEIAHDAELPEKAVRLADSLFVGRSRAGVINLDPLEQPGSDTDFVLAADGESEDEPAVYCCATLFSEDPEIVLRVMRDTERRLDYLQLISYDSGLISRVMVRIPETGAEYITDERGHASLGEFDPLRSQSFKWQVKMPDAIFDLEPLEYDPDEVNYASEVMLETENRDRLQVTFEGRAEGKQIRVKILELDGAEDFGMVKVVVSQQDSSVMAIASPDETITFEVSEPGSSLNIRLFQ